MSLSQKVFRYTRTPSPPLQLLVLLLRLVAFVFYGIFLLLFAWWLAPILERLARRTFAEDIQKAVPSLFDRYGARIIKDPFPAGNDPSQSYLTLGIENLILKFSKWREENYRIEVAPAYAPRDSRELVEALKALDQMPAPLPASADVSWRPYSKILEDGLPALQEAFKEQNYAATKEKISQMYRKGD